MERQCNPLDLERCPRYGPNKIHIEVPTLWDAFWQSFLTVVGVYQLICILDYAFWGCWNLSLVWIVVLVGSSLFRYTNPRLAQPPRLKVYIQFLGDSL